MKDTSMSKLIKVTYTKNGTNYYATLPRCSKENLRLHMLKRQVGMSQVVKVEDVPCFFSRTR